ncbi:hypothetical protein GALL_526970 [mine drainage metagenome]|uniref:Uncharacterized protein n=1 Tax=mine drainage metagenome TaxID=410659 RepID=A0A1J5PQ87_9ZZZZ
MVVDSTRPGHEKSISKSLKTPQTVLPDGIEDGGGDEVLALDDRRIALLHGQRL